MPGKLVEAWSAGMRAGRSGETIGVNPHPRGTELAGHWADGWREGVREARQEAERGPNRDGQGGRT